MFKDIPQFLAQVAAFKPSNPEDLENFRLHYLGKKGVLTQLFADLKTLEPAEKKAKGQEVNALKQAVDTQIALFKNALSHNISDKPLGFDVTLPATIHHTGSKHPINIIKQQIVGIFERMGYTLSEGPEMVGDWHNFGALNFTPEHPARDMQDTFFLQTQPDVLLRTHTSSVQVKEMETGLLPIRTISPGRVYRNETISARAHCQFHQIEGLYIAEEANFASLKQTLYVFAQELYGENVKIRFRPSYFPFTEPSAEMDISCQICHGDGCNVCKHTGWVEILGCGMVDPQVLQNCNINPNTYQGFAFGMGIERIAMLKYGIKDLRLFYENDVRFLRQFSGFNI